MTASARREVLVDSVRNVKTGRCSNLDPAGGSFCVSRRRWSHSLFVWTTGRLSPSAALPVVPVGVKNGVRPEIADKPDNQRLPLGDLRDAGTHLHGLEHDQKVEATPVFQKQIVVVPQCY